MVFVFVQWSEQQTVFSFKNSGLHQNGFLTVHVYTYMLTQVPFYTRFSIEMYFQMANWDECEYHTCGKLKNCLYLYHE